MQREQILETGDVGCELFEARAGNDRDRLSFQVSSGNDFLPLLARWNVLLVFGTRRDAFLYKTTLRDDEVQKDICGLSRHVAAHGVAGVEAQRGDDRVADTLVRKIDEREE